MKTNNYWHKPTDRIPDTQAILIVYEDQVWPGVHSKGRVIRFPEDFDPVDLVDCEFWCTLPEVPL